MSNASDPAYPTHDVYQDCGLDGNSGPVMTQTTKCGLSKRERLAMAAMQGLMARDIGAAYNSQNLHIVAKNSVKAADALLAELAKEHQ